MLGIIALKIEGMKCGGCSNGLMQKVLREFPKSKFSADHVTSSGLLIADDESNLSQHLNFIAAQGYKVALESEVEKTNAINNLIQLAISFFCFANVMVFACSEYFASPGELTKEFLVFFRWSSAVLCSVSLFYCARNILIRGFLTLRTKVPSVDFSISLALMIAYLFSVGSLFWFNIDPFFDSIAATIFFILVGRHFQNSFLNSKNNSVNQAQQKITYFGRRLQGESEQLVDVLLIEPGDELKVLPGEILPVVSTLKSKAACVSLDLINGESEPQVITKGNEVMAGAVGIQRPFVVIAKESGEQSQLKKIQWQSFRLSAQKSILSTLSDRISFYFYGVVIFLAVCCFFYSLGIGVTAAISRSVAILLVSCPCAFAIAIPLATLRCALQASRQKIIFKNANSIQNLAECKNAIFDKTGTLSENNLKIERAMWGDSCSKDLRAAIRAACRQSSHPVALALAAEISKEICTEPSNSVKTEEVFGSGLSVDFSGRRLYIGSRSYCRVKDFHDFDLFVCDDNYQILAKFKVTETQAKDAGQCVEELKTLGLQVAILSGDSHAKVQQFSKKTGIDNFVAEASPTSKYAFLNDLSPSVMIGNGFNDAMALSKAHTGISVAGSNGAAFEFSDVHLLSSSLLKVPLAVKLSRRTMKHIHQSFLFAATYNLVAINLAFAGWLTPVVAAILMPINGIIVSAIAARELKL